MRCKTNTNFALLVDTQVGAATVRAVRRSPTPSGSTLTQKPTPTKPTSSVSSQPQTACRSSRRTVSGYRVESALSAIRRSHQGCRTTCVIPEPPRRSNQCQPSPPLRRCPCALGSGQRSVRFDVAPRRVAMPHLSGNVTAARGRRRSDRISHTSNASDSVPHRPTPRPNQQQLERHHTTRSATIKAPNPNTTPETNPGRPGPDRVRGGDRRGLGVGGVQARHFDAGNGGADQLLDRLDEVAFGGRGQGEGGRSCRRGRCGRCDARSPRARTARRR